MYVCLSVRVQIAQIDFHDFFTQQRIYPSYDDPDLDFRIYTGMDN